MIPILSQSMKSGVRTRMEDLSEGAAALVLHRDLDLVVLPVVIEPRLPLDHVTSC